MIKTKGFKELDAFLAAFPAKLQKNAVRSALTAAASGYQCLGVSAAAVAAACTAGLQLLELSEALDVFFVRHSEEVWPIIPLPPPPPLFLFLYGS